jgi:hypothetical protein
VSPTGEGVSIASDTWGTPNIDISPFISSQTQVRFRVSNKYGG